MTHSSISLILSYLLMYFIYPSNCSLGDSYPTFRSCVQKCRMKNCSDHNSYSPAANRKWFIKLLWNCYADCEYECMWPTINICRKNGWNIPQFRGKWPFIRWLGIQEPASAIFSLLNLFMTLIMYKKFYRAVQTRSLMYWAWSGHAIIGANAWIWSVIFHIRDIPFPEQMDYIGSCLFIYYIALTIGLRIFIFQHVAIKLLLIFACLFLFSQHLSYVILTSFDYKCNFNILLLIGILTGVSTLTWSFWNYRKAVHFKYITAYVLNIIMVAGFEVFDFPPILWTFDAHALWHLGTVPVSYFLYKFAIEDCRYLRRVSHQTTAAVIS